MRSILLALFVACAVSCAAAPVAPRYLDSASHVDSILQSTVALVAADPNSTGSYRTFCTAFFIAPRVLGTAGHCVQPHDSFGFGLPATLGATLRFQVYGQPLATEPHSARLIALDDEHDVALLQLATTEAASAHYFAIGTAVRIGAHAFVCGHPLGMGWNLTEGIISRIVDGPNGLEEIWSDANIYFGNSGGPLLDEHGQVIGVADAIARGQSYLGIFVPMRFVEALRAQAGV